MYTVLIVDCDEEFRKRMIEEVPWSVLGLQVVGEASDGACALQLAKELEPDLLLTEIQIPGLNGIELTRQLREIRPSIQVVFMSDCEEFSYAQQAIQYNIVNYILKPVHIGRLRYELEIAKEKMDAYFTTFSRMSGKAYRIEKSDFLFPLLFDGSGREALREENLREEAVACGFLRDIHAESMRYMVVVTRVVDEENHVITDRASVEAVDMILNKYVRYASCYSNGCIVSAVAMTPFGLKKYLPIFAEEMIQNVERIMNARCNIQMSYMVDHLKECRKAYVELSNYEGWTEKRDTSYYAMMEQEMEECFQPQNLHQQMERLDALLRCGTEAELEVYLEEMARVMREERYTSNVRLFVMMQMVAVVYQTVCNATGNKGNDVLHECYPIAQFQGEVLLGEKYQMMRKMCVFAQKLLKEQGKKSSVLICEKAMESIETRYSDLDLSVAIVSEEIGVSPNYLSSLIKKNTAKTFVELLTEKRICRAEELLTHTSMRIREVTEMCGYRDQYYFSHCFKKILGVSPNTYRKEKQKENAGKV